MGYTVSASSTRAHIHTYIYIKYIINLVHPVYTCARVYIYVCTYVCMNVCMYICMYAKYAHARMCMICIFFNKFSTLTFLILHIDMKSFKFNCNIDMHMFYINYNIFSSSFSI